MIQGAKALIKSLENKHLNPGILDPFRPTRWEKNQLYFFRKIWLFISILGWFKVFGEEWADSGKKSIYSE